MEIVLRKWNEHELRFSHASSVYKVYILLFISDGFEGERVITVWCQSNVLKTFVLEYVCEGIF